MLSTILKSTTPKNISCLQLLVTVAWWSFILSVSNKEGIYEIIHAWHKVQETHLISLPLIVIYQMVKVFLLITFLCRLIRYYWDIYFVGVRYWGKHIFILFSTRPPTHSFSHTHNYDKRQTSRLFREYPAYHSWLWIRKTTAQVKKKCFCEWMDREFTGKH